MLRHVRHTPRRAQAHAASSQTPSRSSKVDRRIDETVSAWNDIYLIRVVQRLDALGEQDARVEEEMKKRPTSVKVLPDIPPYRFSYSSHHPGHATFNYAYYANLMRQKREEFKQHMNDMMYKRSDAKAAADNFLADLRHLSHEEKKELYEELRKERLAKNVQKDRKSVRLMNRLKFRAAAAKEEKRTGEADPEVSHDMNSEAADERRERILLENRKRLLEGLDVLDITPSMPNFKVALQEDFENVSTYQSEDRIAEKVIGDVPLPTPSFRDAQVEETVGISETWELVPPAESFPAGKEAQNDQEKDDNNNGWGEGAPTIKRLSSSRRTLAPPFLKEKRDARDRTSRAPLGVTNVGREAPMWKRADLGSAVSTDRVVPDD